jgi:NAD(P)-dependent dehydrogenase (short-subunit alcohol dehydrogenase family)
MNQEQPTILVTGASSGIGRSVALDLAKRGYSVFASVRREADAETLRSQAPSTLIPVLFDVTDARAVESAEAQIAEIVGARGLTAVINNAGIPGNGPLEYTSTDELREIFEVNVFGTLFVTRTFLPLLRRAQGRILNVSSGLGRFAAPLVGSYSMSKFALEAMSDCLRVELRQSGVAVIIIEPGFVDTPIIAKGNDLAKQGQDELPPDAPDYYRHSIRTFIEFMQKVEPCQPQLVAEVVHRALTARRPRARYPVGAKAKIMTRLGPLLPSRMFDRMLGQMVDI